MENVQILDGYEEFRKFTNEIKPEENQKVNFYFTGSKDENGKSWCPDCVEALPHVNEGFKKFGGDSTMVMVNVGDRPYWKDMSNPFRLDKDTHLMVIPTLIRWKKPQRLEGDQCNNDNLIEMFFTDEDD